jgi:predicted Zn-dependent protease
MDPAKRNPVFHWNTSMIKKQMMRVGGLLIGAMALSGCQAGSPLSAESIGNMVGGDTGHLIKAGGHAANAAALGEKDEDAMGQSVALAVTNRYGLVNNDKLTKYVTLVGLTVASGSPRPAGNYVFGVLDSPEVNAFSGPNGYIFITRGALAMLQNEAELAGVLGHEIAHVCNHDGLHQIQAAEQRGALSELVQADSDTARFSALADAGIDVITKQGYTQPQELDADAGAVRTMAAAGYDPAAYLAFLKRLETAEGKSAGNRLMSTHPGVAKRTARVNEALGTVKPGGATLAERFARNVGK